MADEIQHIASKSILVFIGKLVGQIISFASVIIIARLLGAETYGNTIFIVSFLSFFSIITNLGTNSGIVSFLSRGTLDIGQKASILSYTLIVTFLLSICIVGICFASRDFVSATFFTLPVHGELFLLLLPTIVLTTINGILLNALRALKRFNEATLIESIFSPLSKVAVVFLFVLILNVKNFYSIVISIYVYQILSFCLMLYRIYKLGYIGKIHGSYKNSQILSFSIPLIFTGAVTVIMQNVDKYMIGLYASSADVAVYRIALLFGTTSSVALASIRTVFEPTISFLFHAGRMKEFSKLYHFTTKWMVTLNLLVFGFVIACSKDIMNIAGDAFRGGGVALIVVSVGQVVNSVVGSVGAINTMTGKPKYNLLSSGIAMGTNVVLNLLLIPEFGIVGAAIATAISLAINNLVSFYLLFRNLKVHPYDRSYIKVGIVFVVTTAVTFLVSKFVTPTYIARLLILGPLYTIMYGVLIYKFAFSNYEMQMIRSRIGKYRNVNEKNDTKE